MIDGERSSSSSALNQRPCATFVWWMIPYWRLTTVVLTLSPPSGKPKRVVVL